MRKDRKEDGEGDAGCGEGTGGGGTLKSERAQAPFKAMPTELRTTEKEKSESPGGGESRAPRPRKGPLAEEAAAAEAGEGGGSLAGLGPPWQPQALAPRGSLPLRSIVPLPGDKEIAF